MSRLLLLASLGRSRSLGGIGVDATADVNAGDLATHALHAVPLAGLTGSRAAVWATALGFTALTLWCFARALMGLPPF